MNDQPISRLEAQLERLVEGAFTRLFGKSIRAQDIAMQLARAMEDNARVATSGDPRPLAPDCYTILLNPAIRQRLLHHQPDLVPHLAEHLLEMATSLGYRLNDLPKIEFRPDEHLDSAQVVVRAEHGGDRQHSTALMQRVDLPVVHPAPRNPQLLLQGRQAVSLSHDVVNIGRSPDNHIVLDDRSVSRYHVQLRLRYGCYVIFDTQSKAGTFVNGTAIKEHQLRNGDVIRIGNTQLVYIEDHTSDSDTSKTMPVEPPG